MQQICFESYEPFSEAGLFLETGSFIDQCSTSVRTAFLLQQNSKLCLLFRELFLQPVYIDGEVAMQISRTPILNFDRNILMILLKVILTVFCLTSNTNEIVR